MGEVDIDGRSPMLGRVYLSYEVGSFPKNLIPPHIRRDENKEPKYTTQQECVMMRRQVRKSKFTEYEFLNVVKANSYMCSGRMYFITFEVRDPYDNLPKLFQARVRYYYDVTDDYILCRPKPNQKVKCVGTAKTHKRLA
ncbi:unnamed protein product [Arabidopsis lyrata]|nr:unnamed protein product [Arabidopsis lyrata]